MFGHLGGVDDLNAVTGAVRWKYNDPTGTEVLSSVAIAGKTNAVVLCADVSGAIHALNLTNGTVLYNYQTGGYIVSSPAVSDGDVLIASSDGLLYDFAVGGGNNATLPTASVTSPAFGSSVPNPGGSEVISGTASDPVAVSSVDVAVEAGGVGGTWWDAATGKWALGPIANSATMATAGEPTTDWSFDFPVPKSGRSYLVSITAHSSGGQASAGSDQFQFVVQRATTGPQLVSSQSDVAAGGSLTVDGNGFTPGENVSISLRGVQLKSVKAGTTGSFVTSVSLPEYAAFGESSLSGNRSHFEEPRQVPRSTSPIWWTTQAAPRVTADSNPTMPATATSSSSLRKRSARPGTRSPDRPLPPRPPSPTELLTSATPQDPPSPSIPTTEPSCGPGKALQGRQSTEHRRSTQPLDWSWSARPMAPSRQ